MRFYWLTRDRFVGDAQKVNVCIDFVALMLDTVDKAERRSPVNAKAAVGECFHERGCSGEIVAGW